MNSAYNLRKIYNNLSSIILNLIYPDCCVVCKKEKTLICNDCEKNLKRNNFKLNDWTIAKYNYKDDILRKIIFKIKYHHTPLLAQSMGEYLKEELLNKIKPESQYILVPVPISTQRLKQRGYNQSLYIAFGIDKSKTFEILKRDRNTEKLHKTKNKQERADALFNAFDINKIEMEKVLSIIVRKNVEEKDTAHTIDDNTKIILIDDIATTGATLYECRRILMNNNIYNFKKENIYALCLAH